MAINRKKKLVQQVKDAIVDNLQDTKLADTVANDVEKALNDLELAVDSRLDQYRSDMVRILRDSYQTRPYQIFTIIDEIVEKINATTTPLTGCLDPIIDNCSRRATADCLKDLIDIYQKAIAEKYLRSKFVQGQKPN